METSPQPGLPWPVLTLPPYSCAFSSVPTNFLAFEAVAKILFVTKLALCLLQLPEKGGINSSQETIYNGASSLNSQWLEMLTFKVFSGSIKKPGRCDLGSDPNQGGSGTRSSELE